jgi:predicted dienelactone hydrolase
MVRVGMLVLASLLLRQPLVAQEKAVWPKADTGPHAVASFKAEWEDAARKRTVPIKIYHPKELKAATPVILFSHGLGGSRDGYTYLGECWASHGYVSVHLQHAGSDIEVLKGTVKPLESMKKAAADPRNAADRAKDVSFVLDQLAKLNQDNEALKGKLDLKSVGLSGHSFGANTSLMVAGQTGAAALGLAPKLKDERIKAIIPMSAPVPRFGVDKAYVNVKIPSLHMTGTLDDSPIGDTKPEERRVPFDKIQGADKFLIIFQDGDHMIFGGRTPKLIAGKRPQDEAFRSSIRKSSVAFWDAYLKNDTTAAAWLKGDGLPKHLGKLATFESKLAP